MSDPLNRVPFPFIGDGTTENGAVLRYRTADMVRLEEKYGPSFTDVISAKLRQYSNSCLQECIRAGLKTANGRRPFPTVDHDDYPFSILEASPLIQDAIVLAITNQSYAELLANRGAEMVAAAASEDPLPGSETAGSFDESSGPDTP